MSDEPRKVPFTTAAKFVIYGLIGGLLLGAGGVAWVWVQGQQATAAAQDELATAISQAEETAAEYDARIARMEERIARLTARAKVSQAIDQLEQRNFGTAADRIEAASNLLENDEKAAEIREALEDVRVDPSADVGAPVQILRGLARRLDEVVEGV